MHGKHWLNSHPQVQIYAYHSGNKIVSIKYLNITYDDDSPMHSWSFKPKNSKNNFMRTDIALVINC